MNYYRLQNSECICLYLGRCDGFNDTMHSQCCLILGVVQQFNLCEQGVTSKNYIMLLKNEKNKEISWI
jgi:hypothetical protein